MKQARVEMRLRNNVLWHAIFDGHRSVAAFCAAHGLEQNRVGNLLNLKDLPRCPPGPRHAGETWTQRPWTKMASRLAAICGIPEEDLFPETLYRRVAEGLPTRAAFEVDPPMLPMGREALQISDGVDVFQDVARSHLP